MMMFENGLLASFIPELLMVLAYFFCLVVPGVKSDQSPENITSKVVYETEHVKIPSSVYKTTDYDFKFDVLMPGDEQVIVWCETNSIQHFFELPYPITSYLSYVQFTRPPPSFPS
jgi:hypothetical protein